MAEDVDLSAPPGERRSRNRFLDLVQSWLPVLTVVVGSLWGLYTYKDNVNHEAEKERQLRLRELRKPFFDKQFAVYLEVAGIVGKLFASNPDSAAWTSAWQRLQELQWGKWPIVGYDPPMPSRVQDFERAIEAYKIQKINDRKPDAENAATQLLGTLQHEIEESSIYQFKDRGQEVN